MPDVQAAAIAAHNKHFNPKHPWMVSGPAGLNVGDPLTTLGGPFMPPDAYLVCAKRSDMREGVWVIVAAKEGGSEGVEFVRWMLDAEAPSPYCFWGCYGSAADAIEAYEARS